VSTTDVSAQTKQAMDNMKAVLSAGKSDFSKVVKTTILLADMADFPKVNQVYANYFEKGQYPARACYAVKTLPKNALVEIEAIAVHD
jgi:2-iminobutanoate/2-iminopropanoate deaminase